MTWALLPHCARPALWPGEDGLRLWPASPEQANDRQRSAAGETSRLPSIRKSRRCSSLPPGRLPLPDSALTSPSPRELEVYGTSGAIRLPDPNAFDGSVFVCKKDSNKTSPKSGWTLQRTPIGQSFRPRAAEGRGMGALDLARGAHWQAPRASADLALHVLDIMESISNRRLGANGLPATTCKLAEPLPATWNPLQKFTQ